MAIMTFLFFCIIVMASFGDGRRFLETAGAYEMKSLGSPCGVGNSFVSSFITQMPACMHFVSISEAGSTNTKKN